MSSNIKFSSILLAILTSSLRVHATTNDWSKPCFDGVCQYDLPTSTNGTGASGTMKIWGAKWSISDVTTAAGWEILGCDPEAMEQDVRLVCQSGEESINGCGHLFATPAALGGGGGSVVQARAVPGNGTVSASAAAASATLAQEQEAVGKIVRLPEGCGKNPFAIVAKAWIPEDQSIPQTIRRRLVTRDGEVPTVKAVRLSVDFGTYGNISNTQPVNFQVAGTNVPGAAVSGDLGTLIPTNSSSTSVRRSRIHGWRRFDLNNTKTLDPIDINKTFNLINAQLPCADVTLSAKVDVEAGVHADVTFGVVASGSIIPPKVDNFGLQSSITADLDGAIILSAGVGGTLDSGSIQIFQLGLPALDFPGVLSIGPTFEVNAEAKASLDLDVDMRVGVAYHIENAQFVFPDGGSQGGTFTPNDTPLTLSAQPSAKATGTIEAHLIPSLNFGVSVLGGKVAKAGVFLNLDASASMTLTVEATGAEESTTISPREVGPALSAAHANGVIVPRGRGMIGEHYFDRRSAQPAKTSAPVVKSSQFKSTPIPTSTKSVASLQPNVTKTKTSAAVEPSSSDASFGGCFEVNTGLSVNVGADASFFDLFDPSVTLPLFSKNFSLFKKCFGDQASQRRGLVRERSLVKMLEGRAQNLKCNSGGQNLTEVVDTTVPKAQIN